MADLFNIMENHGVKIGDDEKKFLEIFLNEVISFNKELNLTRISDFDEGIIRHIEDSLTALPYFVLAPEGKYIDLGSGSGFPAIPLSYMTKRSCSLTDSIQKKAHALNKIIENIGTQEYMHCYDQRIEDVAKNFGAVYSVATARALAPLASLLELASPLLKKNGIAIFFKGTPTEEEQTKAKDVAEYVGFTLVEQKELSLSDGSHRELFVYKKTHEPKISLPRRVGMAQKKPLKVK